MLRFPDLEGVAVRAQSRVPGLNDVEYFAQSLYAPEAYIVPGFNPGMPVINKPPIGLTDQEILTVIAYLQSLGGTPTVTLQTSHKYYAAPGATPAPAGAPAPGAPPGGAQPPAAAPVPGAAPSGAQPPAAAPAPGSTAPGGAQPPAAAPAPGAAPRGAQPPAAPQRGAQLRPAASMPDVATVARAGDPDELHNFVSAVAILRPVVAHQTEARLEGAVTR